MRKLLAYIVLGCLIIVSGAAADDFIYHGSFLWNDVRAIVHVDDFLYCAFHDGVGVVDLRLDFAKKKLTTRVQLPELPLRLHRFGDHIAVEHESGRITILDISQREAPVVLGSFVPDLEYRDVQGSGDYLYLAMGYYGLFRYDISDPSNVNFKDSSMVGIHVIELQQHGQHLLALDDYNGVLLYEADADTLLPVSSLLLPYRATTFLAVDDTVYAPLHPNGYMVSSLTDPLTPEYIEIRQSFLFGQNIEKTSRGLVLFNTASGFELIYGSGDTQTDNIYQFSNITGYGDVYQYMGRDYFAVPTESRGFAIYDIVEPESIMISNPAFSYAYPGPITQVMFHNGRLHVVGTSNWYELYDLSDPSSPERTGKLINPPFSPAGVCTKGDTLFIADYETNLYFNAVDDGTGDPEVILPLIPISTGIGRPFIYPDYFPDGDLLYTHNIRKINGTFRNDSTFENNLYDWTIMGDVRAAVFGPSVLYVGLGKGLLAAYNITRFGNLEGVSTQNITGKANMMLIHDSLLYIAAGGLLTYSIADPGHPVQVDYDLRTGTVHSLEIQESWLICGADNGIYIYSIENGLPELLFSGGKPAMTADLYDGILAASDGYSIKIYSLPVLDTDDDVLPIDIAASPRIVGYPNPFNPDITLKLQNFQATGEPIIVSVFNILGERVRELPVVTDYSNSTVVQWDGTDDRGQRVASGLYLFRAADGTNTATLKAILLK